MKKTLALSLAAVLAAMVTACSNGNGDNNVAPSANTAGASAEASDAAGTFPLSKDKKTLTVLAVQSPYVQDYETNDFTKYYEELTNVHVEWKFAPPQEAQEKLNLALTSGDLPDVIVGFGVSSAQQMVYGQQGIFLPLNDLIDKYGVETKQLFDKYPEVKQAITAPDGSIYALSGIDRNPHTMAPQKMWIYEPWLKKLNLAMPTTTDEFESVLKAFKTMDPNGNGKKDEIPMSGGVQDSLTGIDSFLMNSFVLHKLTSNQLLFDDNGKINADYVQDGYQEGLANLHKLYAEGLIDDESFTQNNSQLKAQVENGDPKIGVVASSSFAQFTDVSKDRWKDFVAVPPLKGPSGLQQTPYLYYSNAGGNFLITSSAKDPELAFRWGDALFNSDISLRANIGTEGVGWKKPDEGAAGLNGGPAAWVRLIGFGTLQNNSWMQTTPYHFSKEMFEGLAADTVSVPRKLYEATVNNYEPYKSSKEQEVPPIFFNEAQAAELTMLQKTIMDYVQESKTRFIIGDLSLAKDWNTYLSTLDGMNLKRYLEIYNEAYTAQYKKEGGAD
ncbi:extracellular solute-binding protein [Paenibacillus sp. JDR-2]|uniref:extracellular solute-binding protein n=1 Tax=Paenibacillus sp. (strain JDR-2) TaxID=324057 RepID=UPI000166BC03|nr:extracellular solute-binding protein [Paenibacillus sp. JDR-2]ACT01912.1 extracellular solute-binding protein family 1 [Paenibacillus sp. JDR-2]